MISSALARALAQDMIRAQGWLRHLEWFDSTDSTNLAARRAVSAKQPCPALFVAERQTQGRGRGAHQWWSPSGCLMMTLAIDSSQAPADRDLRQLLSFYCGVAVAEAVDQWLKLPRAEVKWPNDLYVNGRKLAGILIESQTSADGDMDWLIGVGLNVSMQWHEAPLEIRERATCMSTCLGAPVDVCEVLVTLVSRLQQAIEQWQAGSTQWFSQWVDRCMLSGKVVQVQVGEHIVTGRCEGIAQSGLLLVRDETTVHQLSSGEVLRWQ